MDWAEYTIYKSSKGDNTYPNSLNALSNPPSAIYYRGELNSEVLRDSIAIVGSRNMTRYGAQTVDQFVLSFTQNNIATISGYMYGVDTEVHRKTVEYGGKTIAVMGNGINQPYPVENDKLYTKTLQGGGVVLSEYKPDTKPQLWMYPQRNRVVAALSSRGVLVIEAGEGSGSLITVNYARQLKKKIYAIPGPITSSVSRGTNYLIKEGIATMVTSPEDIIGLTLKTVNKGKNKKTGLSDLEQRIYKCLKNEELNVDEISVATGTKVIEVSTALSMMSLKGIVSEAGGRYFVL